MATQRSIGKGEQPPAFAGLAPQPEEAWPFYADDEIEAVAEVLRSGRVNQWTGETVKAFVVRKPGNGVTEEEILAFCKERLAPYKTPKAVEFRDELPKSTVGKLLRRVLADEERAKIEASAQATS